MKRLEWVSQLPDSIEIQSLSDMLKLHRISSYQATTAIRVKEHLVVFIREVWPHLSSQLQGICPVDPRYSDPIIVAFTDVLTFMLILIDNGM